MFSSQPCEVDHPYGMCHFELRSGRHPGRVALEDRAAGGEVNFQAPSEQRKLTAWKRRPRHTTIAVPNRILECGEVSLFRSVIQR